MAHGATPAREPIQSLSLGDALSVSPVGIDAESECVEVGAGALSACPLNLGSQALDVIVTGEILAAAKTARRWAHLSACR